MRRRALIVAALAVVAAVVVVVVATGGGPGNSGYKVDVVFDNARGLIPGQLVEVAGGRVGEIDSVSVTPDFRARISMTVERRFAPFHRDAQCTIRPQGLIAENYVQCDPGTTAAPPLRATGGHPPTVPVTHTTEPVNLTDLFAIWNVPTRDRLAVLLSQLGVSTAGRGNDLNALLRRANPTLALARRAIEELDGQRRDLLSAVDDTSTTLASLGPHAQGTEQLLRHAAAVLTRTGIHAADLSDATRRLPGMLTAARPALASLDALATSGTPLLAQIHRTVPALLDVTTDTPRLARAARPALAKLGPVLDRGVGVVKRATPLAQALRIYAHQSLPSARLTGRLLSNLTDRGFSASLAHFFYNATLATARFDSTSHILPAHIGLSQCAQYSATPEPGCGATYYNQTSTAARMLRYLLG
jgi:phospholipid/cholesterol/gamma-HCH transport system substrate-binding protein